LMRPRKVQYKGLQRAAEGGREGETDREMDRAKRSKVIEEWAGRRREEEEEEE